MSIKTSFSIKDLENLSGVKAHTIRIWEKRYDLLTPERSDTNIRTYDMDNLQKLLNVSALMRKGVKISKISKLTDAEIQTKVKEETLSNGSNETYLNAFKLAMLNFDTDLFEATYHKLLSNFSFREVFLGTFLPLLEDLGVLWMTNTIHPVHERFISTLIQQKLLINIERVQGKSDNTDVVYALFLPLNEMHDLGLLYLHFELLLKGNKSIFLGHSIPQDDLIELQSVFPKIQFISYLTVQPSTESTLEYLSQFSADVLTSRGEQLHILGRNARSIPKTELPANVRSYDTLNELLEVL
jgi:DNA-binding transcriptional MerR regulator